MGGHFAAPHAVQEHLTSMSVGGVLAVLGSIAIVVVFALVGYLSDQRNHRRSTEAHERFRARARQQDMEDEVRCRALWDKYEAERVALEEAATIGALYKQMEVANQGYYQPYNEAFEVEEG